MSDRDYKRILELDVKILDHVDYSPEEKQERKRIMDRLSAEVADRANQYE